MDPDALVLAVSVRDWIERATPLVLFAFAVVVVMVRRRERLRGPDEDDDLDELDDRHDRAAAP